ncbi:hypothetical protein KAI87_04935 [Myxococcota bacterium]|nr:hypothetical protein [Myxococcota bacterium]
MPSIGSGNKPIAPPLSTQVPQAPAKAAAAPQAKAVPTSADGGSDSAKAAQASIADKPTGNLSQGIRPQGGSSASVTSGGGGIIESKDAFLFKTSVKLGGSENESKMAAIEKAMDMVKEKMGSTPSEQPQMSFREIGDEMHLIVRVPKEAKEAKVQEADPQEIPAFQAPAGWTGTGSLAKTENPPSNAPAWVADKAKVVEEGGKRFLVVVQDTPKSSHASMQRNKGMMGARMEASRILGTDTISGMGQSNMFQAPDGKVYIQAKMPISSEQIAGE